MSMKIQMRLIQQILTQCTYLLHSKLHFVGFGSDLNKRCTYILQNLLYAFHEFLGQIHFLYGGYEFVGCENFLEATFSHFSSTKPEISIMVDSSVELIYIQISILHSRRDGQTIDRVHTILKFQAEIFKNFRIV